MTICAETTKKNDAQALLKGSADNEMPQNNEVVQVVRIMTPKTKTDAECLINACNNSNGSAALCEADTGNLLTNVRAGECTIQATKQCGKRTSFKLGHTRSNRLGVKAKDFTIFEQYRVPDPCPSPTDSPSPTDCPSPTDTPCLPKAQVQSQCQQEALPCSPKTQLRPRCLPNQYREAQKKPLAITGKPLCKPVCRPRETVDDIWAKAVHRNQREMDVIDKVKEESLKSYQLALEYTNLNPFAEFLESHMKTIPKEHGTCVESVAVATEDQVVQLNDLRKTMYSRYINELDKSRVHALLVRHEEEIHKLFATDYVKCALVACAK